MPNFVETQRYESLSESDDTMDYQHTRKKIIVKRKFDWIKDESFSNDAEVQTAIKQEEQCSRYYTNTDQDGVKVCYRCNKAKFCVKQYNATIYIYYPHDKFATVEWLRCSTRIHKILCSDLSILIHGMTLDKSLTAKLSRMAHLYRANISSSSTLDGRGADTVVRKKKRTEETGCMWIPTIIAAGPNRL